VSRIEASTRIVALEAVARHSAGRADQWENRRMAVVKPPLEGDRVLRLGVQLLAAAAIFSTVLLVPRQEALPATTYAGASGLARAADVVAGLSLLVAGLTASIARPRGTTAVVALLAGAAWFAPDWVGWESGPPLLRSVGMVVAPFLPPLLFHLVLAAPSGRLATRLARVTLIALYAVAAAVSVGQALIRDPFLDRYCWSNCTDNVFLARAEPDLARLLGDLWLLSVAIGASAVVALGAWRLARETMVARRQLVPTLAAGAAVTAAEASSAVTLLGDPAESPDDTFFAALFLARALAVTMLAAAVIWGAYVAWRARSAVARLAADLGEALPPGSLRAALAASLRDPTLEVAYPLSGSTRFVDGDGNPVAEPVTGPGRVLTPIVREGRPVAVVAHARSTVGEDELARDIGTAARLAVENERLQAEVLARLHDLRASRARIVEVSGAERRQLERDLHDGAQQRLLALTYDLHLARAAAEAEGDGELSARLDNAVDETDAALEELRELAHGIYPAILAEAGLAPALWNLVDEAPIAVEFVELTRERYPHAAEAAAYIMVDDAIAHAARREATHAVVRTRRDGTSLVVEVEDDGEEPTSVPMHLADRLGALGGRVERHAGVLRGEIPCA
jgi:signal transduction histidine kinase